MDVEGTAATLAGSGSLRIDAGAIADEPFDSFSTQLRVAQSIWKLQNIQLTKNHGRLSGDLTLEPERRFASGQLEGTDFRLADIHRLPMTASTALPKGRLDGNLNFEARGQGTPEDFHLQSSWRIRNLSVAGTPLGEFHGTLTGEGNQLRLEGEDQSPGGNLHLSARATAQGDWPMEAEGEYSSLRADPWIRAFFNREFAAAVTLGGSFHAAGPLRTPAKIDLQSHARDVAVDFPSVQWRNVQPVDVHYSDGRLALSRFVMRGPSTELEIEGAVGFTDGVTLALSAEGTANATLLTVFDPNLQATGRSTLRLRLTGTPARPVLNGAIDIQDVSLDYSGLPFRFNNLQGTINLEGERAVIRSLRGTSGGGTVNLSGFVTLVESPRFEVRADLSQVRVRYPPSFTSVLDGNLRLGGGVEQAQLQGELVVRQMVVNENINFISKIIESSNPLMEQPATVTSPLASKIRLNVRVTSAPPVQVQTPNLRLVGDIDIRLQGTVANPVQVGSIHFLSGESVFRGNRYTLVRGDMNMTNPFRTQAYLDLEAQTRVQSYDLTLDISGPFDRLKFAYRSDPPLATYRYPFPSGARLCATGGSLFDRGRKSHRHHRRLRHSLRSSFQPDDQPHSASVRCKPNQDRSQRGSARLRLRRSRHGGAAGHARPHPHLCHRHFLFPVPDHPVRMEYQRQRFGARSPRPERSFRHRIPLPPAVQVTGELGNWAGARSPGSNV